MVKGIWTVRYIIYKKLSTHSSSNLKNQEQVQKHSSQWPVSGLGVAQNE